MREIKFRFYNTENHNIVSDVYGIYHGGKKGSRFFTMPDDEIVVNIDHPDLFIEQFIGLKDKNGKEIYEGDIVKEDGVQNNETIEWSESGARYKIACSDLYEDYAEYHIEVIGNIHENPELLERTK